MNENSEQSYITKVLKNKEVSDTARMAIIVDKDQHHFVLLTLPLQLPTYVISNFHEMRAALSEKPADELIALDLRELPIGDIQPFADFLAPNVEAQGTVYVLTDEQYNCFSPEAFSLVMRLTGGNQWPN